MTRGIIRHHQGQDLILAFFVGETPGICFCDQARLVYNVYNVGVTL